jgi:hypothetical protein
MGKIVAKMRVDNQDLIAKATGYLEALSLCDIVATQAPFNYGH